MKAALLLSPPDNVVALPTAPKSKPHQRKQQFKIIPFLNPSGEKVWRVSGCKLDGARVRENFQDENKAQCRQVELQAEYLQHPADTSIRATKLSQEQLGYAEQAILRLGDDWKRIVEAVDHWTRTGAKSLSVESPRIDTAVDDYLGWLAASTFRDATKRHWRIRMTLFKNSVANVRVAEVTPEFIEAFLATRKTSPSGKDTDRRAISRFFSWCIERPRRWALSNPCREVKVVQGEKAAPSILSIEHCNALLRAAEAHKGGAMAPYLAVCLFGGLRPFEAGRLPWKQVNLEDGEILLEAAQTKTNKKRIVKICPTLRAWLKAHKDKPFFPSNWRKEFKAVKAVAGIKAWPADVLRHTAISHYFRQTGSYGFTAEQFGNSENIIKDHYQGRVSSADTKAFYKLMPEKKGEKQ